MDINNKNLVANTPGYGFHIGKWQNTRKHHTQESQEVSPFPTRIDQNNSNKNPNELLKSFHLVMSTIEH